VDPTRNSAKNLTFPFPEMENLMIETLKTLHFVSLWAAGGIGAGGWIIQYVLAKNGARPSLELVQSMRLMGLLALVSIVTLWATGYSMAMLIYGALPSATAFHIKLLAAALVLLGSIGTNLETLRSMRAGTPPRAALMNTLVWIVRGSLIVVLVMTAISFS
jgi:hypothetical protein